MTESEFKNELFELERVLSSMLFIGSNSDEVLDTTWGIVKIAKINIASENEIRTIIRDVDEILDKYPQMVSVVNTRITASRALYKHYLHRKIQHDEVESLF